MLVILFNLTPGQFLGHLTGFLILLNCQPGREEASGGGGQAAGRDARSRKEEKRIVQVEARRSQEAGQG